MQPASAAPTERPIESLVNRLVALSDRDAVTLADVLEALGRHSFLPMLIVPALLLVSPLSGIPFFSAVCGLTIALTAGQLVWPGREVRWLPARLMRQQVSGHRARQAISGLCRLARWLDRNATPRLHVVVERQPGRSVLEFACLLAGLAIPVLEIVPFSSSVLGLSVVLITTGLLTRDGLFAICGLCVLAAAPLIPLFAFGILTGHAVAGG